jgi:hypothetical protein
MVAVVERAVLVELEFQQDLLVDNRLVVLVSLLIIVGNVLDLDKFHY